MQPGQHVLDDVIAVSDEDGNRVDDIAEHDARQRDHEHVGETDVLQQGDEAESAGQRCRESNAQTQPGRCACRQQYRQHHAETAPCERAGRRRRNEFVVRQGLHDDAGNGESRTGEDDRQCARHAADETDKAVCPFPGDEARQAEILYPGLYREDGQHAQYQRHACPEHCRTVPFDCIDCHRSNAALWPLLAFRFGVACFRWRYYTELNDNDYHYHLIFCFTP